VENAVRRSEHLFARNEILSEFRNLPYASEVEEDLRSRGENLSIVEVSYCLKGGVF